MEYYITNFANVKKLTSQYIPISTAMWNPKWWKYEVNKHGVFTGISEKALSPEKLSNLDLCCSKTCKFKEIIPNCPFLTAYRQYLDTVDIQYIINEFTRIANDVRKITNFIGEPKIVLLVYEAEQNKCSEREALITWFKKNNLILNNLKF